MQPEHTDLHAAYGHLYVSWNEPAVEPPGECLPNSEIFRRLAQALGLDAPAPPASRMSRWQRRCSTRSRCARPGITVETLREHGWVRLPGLERGTARFAEGGFPTPSGKVAPPSRTAWPEQGVDPLVGYVPPHEAGDAELAERYPLVLIAPAGRFFVNSTFASTPWHLKKMGPPQLHLHPSDAARAADRDGDLVRVYNDRGEFVAEARGRRRRPAGRRLHLQVVLAGASRPGGNNVNATTPERDTDLGGGPTFHDNRVEVEAAGSRSATTVRRLRPRRPGRQAARSAARSGRGPEARQAAKLHRARRARYLPDEIRWAG